MHTNKKGWGEFPYEKLKEIFWIAVEVFHYLSLRDSKKSIFILIVLHWHNTQ